MTARSKALQIYMKPGVAEDDLMLAIWDAARRSARPQDVFRAMLRAGLRSMVESGDMPDAVVRDCDLDEIFERRRRRETRNADTRSRVAEHLPHHPMHAPHFPAPYPYGYAPPMPIQPAPQPEYNRPFPAAVPQVPPAGAAESAAPGSASAPVIRSPEPAGARAGDTAVESGAGDARNQRDKAADPADHREAAPVAAEPARKGRIGALM